ncbi:MAG: glycosyl transferase [bacterium]
MIYNYCTLFDSFYLSRGLALYYSLKETTPNFRLYVFPFDKKTASVLQDMKLENLLVVEQDEFENDELRKIKTERTRGEYCWTCTPVIIDFCIQNFNLSQCTYLDADLFFFSSANKLIDEMGTRSVLITDHRYTPKYDQSKTSGKYCVQFVSFKNNEAGLKVLNWWKDACIEWCFDRYEDGKFGDQKYLDDWPKRFVGIYDLPNEGAGLAPWNIQQYEIVSSDEPLRVRNKTTSQDWLVVFYHFHWLRFLDEKRVDMGTYTLSLKVKDVIYQRYIKKLDAIHAKLAHFGVEAPVQKYSTKSGLPIPLHKVVRRVLGVYNIYELEE